MKTFITCVALCFCVNAASAGECVNGSCNLRSRTVTVARELISVPVEVTRRTVEATRNVGRRTVARVRSVVR
jgi:hypothetical protein